MDSTFSIGDQLYQLYKMHRLCHFKIQFNIFEQMNFSQTVLPEASQKTSLSVSRSTKLIKNIWIDLCLKDEASVFIYTD